MASIQAEPTQAVIPHQDLTGKGTAPALARRSFLRAGVVSTSAAVLSCSPRAGAEPAGTPAAPPSGGAVEVTAGPVEVQPLPFDPKKLTGLSERLLVSHHDNNYAGAVRKLNAVEKDLDSLKPTAAGFLLGSLQAKRLAFENSVILHEAYFDNLGGNGELGATTRQALINQFGSMTAFETRFTLVATSLAGGSGWTLLTYHLHRRKLSIDIAADHSQTCANSVVLLALDMYEHSYHMDFGTQAARYIEAFMKNVEGQVVEERLEGALAMTKATRA